MMRYFARLIDGDQPIQATMDYLHEQAAQALGGSYAWRVDRFPHKAFTFHFYAERPVDREYFSTAILHSPASLHNPAQYDDPQSLLMER